MSIRIPVGVGAVLVFLGVAASQAFAAEADRPVCENHPKMGSHLAQIECTSARQRNAESQQWRTKLLERGACSGGLCSGN